MNGVNVDRRWLIVALVPFVIVETGADYPEPRGDRVGRHNVEVLGVTVWAGSALLTRERRRCRCPLRD